MKIEIRGVLVNKIKLVPNSIRSVFGVLILLIGCLLSAAFKTSAPMEPLSLSTLFVEKTSGDRSAVVYRFSGTNADTINQARLCLATDDTCSSCGVPFINITSGTPISYALTSDGGDTGGTSYQISSSAIAQYLTSSQMAALSSGTYYIGLYVQSSVVSGQG